jgi:AcrR family transcriptional regulator
MSPRPRQTSDAELLAATARAMQRISPLELTLADVAEEAGVVPATLIQRFGTKRNLLLANCRAWTGGVVGQFDAARATSCSLLAAIVEFFVRSGSFASTPRSMANALAYLQIDLTDPDFHALLLTQSKTIYLETKKLLDQAIAAGELKPCDTGSLAHLIQQLNSGATLDWAVYQTGSLSTFIRRSLETLLAPYQRPQMKKKKNLKTGRNRSGRKPSG